MGTPSTWPPSWGYPSFLQDFVLVCKDGTPATVIGGDDYYYY